MISRLEATRVLQAKMKKERLQKQEGKVLHRQYLRQTKEVRT